MIKKVLVTGATGFTGSFVVRELCGSGCDVYCFVRDTGKLSVIDGSRVSIIEGDLNNPKQLCRALDKMDALVNVASIGFGHGPSIVQACVDAGVRRAIFFSTTAIFTTLSAQSKGVRLKAEEAIKESTLNYTIFRPTMIYGTPRDRNMIKLIKLVERLPAIPVFGQGKSLQQPVFVRDLAQAVTRAIELPCTFRKEYNLSGKEPLTYNEVIDTVASLFHKRVKKVHFPVGLSLKMVQYASLIPGLPKINPEQVLRLNEDKAFSHQEAFQDFAYSPVSFREGIAQEIKEYKLYALNGRGM